MAAVVALDGALQVTKPGDNNGGQRREQAHEPCSCWLRRRRRRRRKKSGGGGGGDDDDEEPNWICRNHGAARLESMSNDNNENHKNDRGGGGGGGSNNNNSPDRSERRAKPSKTLRADREGARVREMMVSQSGLLPRTADSQVLASRLEMTADPGGEEEEEEEEVVGSGPRLGALPDYDDGETKLSLLPTTSQVMPPPPPPPPASEGGATSVRPSSARCFLVSTESCQRVLTSRPGSEDLLCAQRECLSESCATSSRCEPLPVASSAETSARLSSRVNDKNDDTLDCRPTRIQPKRRDRCCRGVRMTAERSERDQCDDNKNNNTNLQHELQDLGEIDSRKFQDEQPAQARSGGVRAAWSLIDYRQDHRREPRDAPGEVRQRRQRPGKPIETPASQQQVANRRAESRFQHAADLRRDCTSDANKQPEVESTPLLLLLAVDTLKRNLRSSSKAAGSMRPPSWRQTLLLGVLVLAAISLLASLLATFDSAARFGNSRRDRATCSLFSFGASDGACARPLTISAAAAAASPAAAAAAAAAAGSGSKQDPHAHVSSTQSPPVASSSSPSSRVAPEATPRQAVAKIPKTTAGGGSVRAQTLSVLFSSDDHDDRDQQRQMHLSTSEKTTASPGADAHFSGNKTTQVESFSTTTSRPLPHQNQNQASKSKAGRPLVGGPPRPYHLLPLVSSSSSSSSSQSSAASFKPLMAADKSQSWQAITEPPAQPRPVEIVLGRRPEQARDELDTSATTERPKATTGPYEQIQQVPSYKSNRQQQVGINDNQSLQSNYVDSNGNNNHVRHQDLDQRQPEQASGWTFEASSPSFSLARNQSGNAGLAGQSRKSGLATSPSDELKSEVRFKAAAQDSRPGAGPNSLEANTAGQSARDAKTQLNLALKEMHSQAPKLALLSFPKMSHQHSHLQQQQQQRQLMTRDGDDHFARAEQVSTNQADRVAEELPRLARNLNGLLSQSDALMLRQALDDRKPSVLSFDESSLASLAASLAAAGAAAASRPSLPVLDLRHLQRHFPAALVSPAASGSAGLALLSAARLAALPSAAAAGSSPTAPSVASSQSAPSISLPPISHFLAPRNPFKLFASSSSPMATRYWPPFGLHQHNHHSSQQQQQQQATKSEPLRHFHASRWFSGFGGTGSQGSSGSAGAQQAARDEEPGRDQMSGVSSSLLQESQAELESISSQLHNHVMAPSTLSNSLFAHSHSAEQLEKLVRAASEAGHLPRGSPPILPAIVSGPGGQTFPGFYIPAIDTDAPATVSDQPRQQQQQQQLASSINAQIHGANHNHQHHKAALQQHLPRDSVMTSASSDHQSGASSGSAVAVAPNLAGSGLLSTIPGTDYILHPDEVRAMIDIGESAWRQQQRQQQHHHHQQHTASASSLHQQQVTGNGNFGGFPSQFDHDAHRPWQQPGSDMPSAGVNFDSSEPASGLMRENHLENLRNYAYVESGGSSNYGAQQLRPGGASSQLDNLQGGASSASERQLGAAGSNQTAAQQPLSQLGTQLNRALMRSRANSLPAIIRVNDQDYIHWPLIQMQSSAQQQQQQQPPPPPPQTNLAASSSSAQESTSRARLPAGNQLQPLTVAPPPPSHNVGNAQQIPAQNQQQQQQQPSPLRLATQLTPSEIRQVEDSILETLIMAQTLQNQRKIMDALATAAAASNQQQQHQQVAGPPSRQHAQRARWTMPALRQALEQAGADQQAARSGLFSRRKRRRRNSAAPPATSVANGKQSSVASQQHFVSMLPLLSMTPLVSFPHRDVNTMQGAPWHVAAAAAALPPGLATISSLDNLKLGEHMWLQPGVASQQQQQQQQTSAGSEQQLVESKMSARLPAVLADQESNKLGVAPESLAAAASSPAASEQRESLPGPELGDKRSLPGDATNLTRGDHSSADSETSGQHAFGSRVKRPTGGAGERGQRTGKSAFGKSEDDHDDQDANNDDKGRSSVRHGERGTLGAAATGSTARPAESGRLVTAFVPERNNREQAISMYKSNAVKATANTRSIQSLRGDKASSLAPSAALSSASSKRVSVDWPAMVSDADYFPAGQSSERQALNHGRMVKLASARRRRKEEEDDEEDEEGARGAKRTKQINKLGETSDNDALESPKGRAASVRQASQSHQSVTGPSAADSRVSPREQVVSNESGNNADELESDDEDESEHEPAEGAQSATGGGAEPTLPPQRANKQQTQTTLAVIQPQATRRGLFVSTQTKLQFAQDYQAREGVPIYNNNVRVAGALDRQRALEATLASAPGLSSAQAKTYASVVPAAAASSSSASVRPLQNLNKLDTNDGHENDDIRAS